MEVLASYLRILGYLTLVFLLLLRLSKKEWRKKSLILKSIIITFFALAFNLSYTSAFGWNLMPGSEEEMILDLLSGGIIGVSQITLAIGMFYEVIKKDKKEKANQ